SSTIKCPHCQGGLELDPRLVGKTVACPHCSREFQMRPPVAQSVEASPVPPRSAAAPPPVRGRGSGTSRDPGNFSILAQQQRTFWPGMLLAIYGGMTMLSAVGTLMALLSNLVPHEVLTNDPRFDFLFEPSALLTLFSFPLIAGAVIFFGGWKLMELDGVIWPILAAILCVLPCGGPCCAVGMPLGAWAMVLIMDPQINHGLRRRGMRRR
ncbi:MAG: hypothetical protein N2C14_04200, partial [Planctomycetales bacterium]